MKPGNKDVSPETGWKFKVSGCYIGDLFVKIISSGSKNTFRLFPGQGRLKGS